jgi:hypothetical protein
MPDELIDPMGILGFGLRTLALLHQKRRINCFEETERILDGDVLL